LSKTRKLLQINEVEQTGQCLSPEIGSLWVLRTRVGYVTFGLPRLDAKDFLEKPVNV